MHGKTNIMELTPVKNLPIYILSPTENSTAHDWDFVGFSRVDFEVLCMSNNEYGNDITKSWSTELLLQYPNSRWITYRGHRLLIRGNPDGTASVVFSANPAFEHIRIIPKTSDEYKKMQEAKEKGKPAVDIESNDKKVKDHDLEKENAKKRTEAIDNVKQSFINTVESILGDQIKNLEASKKVGGKEIDADITDISKKSLLLEDIAKKVEGFSQQEKKAFANGVKDKAIKKVLTDALDALGNGYSDKLSDSLAKKVSSGIDNVDYVLDKLDLSNEDALAIAQASKGLKDAIKEIQSEYKIAVKKEQPIIIASLQGIGITDVSEPSSGVVDSLLRDELSKIESAMRLEQNMLFYDKLDERSYKDGVKRKSAVRLALQGAEGTINSVAGFLLGSKGFNSDIMSFLGLKNASIILAQNINLANKRDETMKDMESIIVERSKDVVKNSMSSVDEMLKTLKDLTDLTEDGTLAKASASGYKAGIYQEMGRYLAMASGSLESSATILDGLRDTKDLTENVQVDGGDNLDALVKKLKKLKIFDKVNILNLDGRYVAEIPYEKASEMLIANKGGNNRTSFVSDLKSGKLTEKNWLPKGQSPLAYDTISKAKYNELSKQKSAGGFEEFENKKGENGYTSKQPEGEKLYRKAFEVKISDAQQEGIKFLENQKRVVLDMGAGMGKTMTYLGMVSQLKETGKLKGSFAVLSPPSRLRAEFLKDKEKFFPNMNVLEIDDVKKGMTVKDRKQVFGDEDVSKLDTHQLQSRAVELAKQGKFDLVLTGHDSVKEGNTYKIISDASPSFVGIDEAHEIIQQTNDSGSQSKRLKAMKSMADSAEYFVAGTGTTVKNNMGELGTLLHITRPDIVPDAKKFGNKYENINQGTSVFQSGAVNEFRREYDDIMLSRRSEVEGSNFTEKKENVKITKSQKDNFKQTEKQYRLDRDNKGKYGIFDKETGKIDFLDAELLKTIEKEEINFSVGGDIPNPKEIAFLKDIGSTGKRIIELGGSGASQRRDYNHERTLHSGEWRENAKLSKMMENIKATPDKKQGILYKNKFSKPAITKALLDSGYKEHEIVFIDGSVTNEKRDKAVTDFQQNPEVKMIVFGEAGATGLNLQAMDRLHHLTRLDTYAKQQQANARGYRKGRVGDFESVYYDSDTPIDNKKVSAINRKKKISDSVGEYKEAKKLSDL